MSAKPAFLTRVRLENYKSIVSCDVPLGPLTFLVGPNGSGKSNFFDSLSFVADSLNHTVLEACHKRGGAEAIPNRGSTAGNHFAIRLDFSLASGVTGHYSVRLGFGLDEGLEILQEQCRIQSEGASHFYDVQSGELLRQSFALGPVVQSDRLYLVPVSSLPEFRPVYDALSGMRFYHPHPEAIREFRPSDSVRDLASDGANLSSILKRLQNADPDSHERLHHYLAAALPGAKEVVVRREGSSDRLAVKIEAETGLGVQFGPESLSDGTLRILAILAAVFSKPLSGVDRLICFEEPEIAIHPGALAVLMSAIEEASDRAQVLVSSHSPEMLDATDSFDLNSLLAVGMENGATTIVPLSESKKKMLRERLFSVGELHRIGQLDTFAPAGPTGAAGMFERL